jgi:hypothetical protein
LRTLKSAWRGCVRHEATLQSVACERRLNNATWLAEDRLFGPSRACTVVFSARQSMTLWNSATERLLYLTVILGINNDMQTRTQSSSRVANHNHITAH